jgi:RNA polymerase sigma-70 factor, ECF subfamily
MELVGPTQGDLVAFYRATVGEVYRYLSKLTAGDRALTEGLTQETYVALVRACRSGTRDLLSLPWLMTTARHAFLQRLRAGRWQQWRHEQTRSAHRDGTGVDHAVVVAEEANRRLRQLPGHQRAVLVLRYIDDLPVAEIARLLGRSVHATESLLARATTNLHHSVVKEAQADARHPDA